jgi:hypothetical protein
MKTLLSIAIALAITGLADAETGSLKVNRSRVAANEDAACFANCSTQNASCKRVCPATLNVPCLSACDSQYQTCTRACQSVR